MKYLAALFLCLTLISCVSVGKLSTPSTKPEILIENKTSKQVLDAIAAFVPTKGFQIDKVTEYGVTAVGTEFTGPFGLTSPATNHFSVVQDGSNAKVYLIQFCIEPQVGVGQYHPAVRTAGFGGIYTYVTPQGKENNSQDAYEMLQQQLVELKKFVEGK